MPLSLTSWPLHCVLFAIEIPKEKMLLFMTFELSLLICIAIFYVLHTITILSLPTAMLRIFYYPLGSYYLHFTLRIIYVQTDAHRHTYATFVTTTSIFCFTMKILTLRLTPFLPLNIHPL